jgi:uncharacterized protein
VETCEKEPSVVTVPFFCASGCACYKKHKSASFFEEMNYNHTKSMQTKIIEELYLLVATAFRLESKAFDYELWMDQIRSMIMITRELSQKYGADEEIVIIATLLHHFTALKGFTGKAENSLSPKEGADSLLSHLGYPDDRILKVKNCFGNKSMKMDRAEASIEEVLMADAKAFAHIQALASLFHDIYANIGDGLDEELTRIRGKLQRDWSNVSAQGKKVYKEKYEKILNAIR